MADASMKRRRELVCWHVHWRADGKVERQYRYVDVSTDQGESATEAQRSVNRGVQGNLL